MDKLTQREKKEGKVIGTSVVCALVISTNYEIHFVGGVIQDGAPYVHVMHTGLLSVKSNEEKVISLLVVFALVLSTDDKIRFVEGVIQDGGPLVHVLYISLLSVKNNEEKVISPSVVFAFVFSTYGETCFVRGDVIQYGRPLESGIGISYNALPVQLDLDFLFLKSPRTLKSVH